MKSTWRLFIAAAVPEEARDFLTGARRAYAAAPGLRMVPRENFHLTLLFLGEIPEAEVSSMQNPLAETARRHAPFTLVLERLEPGPAPARPRLVWARFQEHEAFSSLCGALAETLTAPPPPGGKFLPHVTLCRFGKASKGAAAPRGLPVVALETEILLPVRSFGLWCSLPASPHPVYEVMEEFPLSGSEV